MKNFGKIYGPYNSFEDMMGDMDRRWESRSVFRKIWDYITIDIPYRLHEFKWWIFHRFHPKHRYHILNTGLGPGWRDSDYLVAWMIRKIFMDFIEQEKPFEEFNISESPHPEEWRQIKDLYEFWKNNDFDKLPYEAVTQKCIETISLRKRFWT